MSDVVARQAKYATRNPISRYLLRGFFASVADLLRRCSYQSVLEVGCGEGLLLHHLRGQLEGRRVAAVDVDRDGVATARRNSPFAQYALASAYDLPFRSGCFDLVICCEVLEHLEDPAAARRELARVARRDCLLSVPREPLWRALNLARGAYWNDWGNTPGHLNHWSPADFRRFVSAELELVDGGAPLPWTVVLARKRVC